MSLIFPKKSMYLITHIHLLLWTGMTLAQVIISVQGSVMLSYQLDIGYQFCDKLNFLLVGAINTHRPTETIQQRPLEYGYTSGRLFFLDKNQTDAFYAGYNDFRIPRGYLPSPKSEIHKKA